MKKYPMLWNDFKQVALKFKLSGRPSFKGLYRLDEYSRFRLISNGHDSSIELKNNLKKDVLHYFSNNIIMLHDSSEKCLLLQYDLISGFLFEIELENQSRFCSDSKNLFVVSPSKNMNSNKFLLSIFGKNKVDEVLTVFKSKTFSLLS